MSGWTDERVAYLGKRWGEGASASRIAAELGGVTRNSVISKVHREHMAERISHQPEIVMRVKRRALPRIRPGNVPAMPQEPRPRARRPTGPVDHAPPSSPPVTFREAGKYACRWIEDDARGLDTLFCGAPAERFSSYCLAHSRVCMPGWGPDSLSPGFAMSP